MSLRAAVVVAALLFPAGVAGAQQPGDYAVRIADLRARVQELEAQVSRPVCCLPGPEVVAALARARVRVTLDDQAGGAFVLDAVRVAVDDAPLADATPADGGIVLLDRDVAPNEAHVVHVELDYRVRTWGPFDYLRAWVLRVRHTIPIAAPAGGTDVDVFVRAREREHAILEPIEQRFESRFDVQARTTDVVRRYDDACARVAR